MTDHCCDNMRTFTRTREDVEGSGVLAGTGRSPLDVPDPVVRFEPGLRLYVISHVAISYCPWCGTKLPEPVEPENGITISVDDQGNIYWNGELVHDQDELR